MKQPREAIEVRQNSPAPSPCAITGSDIQTVKRSLVERLLTFSPEEAGAIFGKSARWALDKVKDGVLIAVDGEAKKSTDGTLQASRFIRITAESVESYRQSITVSPEKWAE